MATSTATAYFAKNFIFLSCLLYGVALFSFERVFETADDILNLAFQLVRLSLCFQPDIADGPAYGLLDFAFDDFRRSDDAILVHDETPEPVNWTPWRNARRSDSMIAGSRKARCPTLLTTGQRVR